MEARVINIMGRAIGADRVVVVAHVDENMRMVERGQCADAHEFLDANPHLRNAWLVMEMRRGGCDHDSLDELSVGEGVSLLGVIKSILAKQSAEQGLDGHSSPDPSHYG
jgi:hypothetical protein